MTIPYETDEDAANLSDDALLEAYLDTGVSKAGLAAAADETTEMPEWPAMTGREVGLTVDTATICWFQANHADWRREMGFVLRAWVMAQAVKRASVSSNAQ